MYIPDKKCHTKLHKHNSSNVENFGMKTTLSFKFKKYINIL